MTERVPPGAHEEQWLECKNFVHLGMLYLSLGPMGWGPLREALDVGEVLVEHRRTMPRKSGSPLYPVQRRCYHRFDYRRTREVRTGLAVAGRAFVHRSFVHNLGTPPMMKRAVLESAAA